MASLEQSFQDFVSYSDGSPPDDEHDPEGATVAWERGQVVTLRRQAEEHLSAIEAALERIEQGTYGRCEVCGGEIEPARLDARPAAVRCVRCAASPSRGA